MTSQPIVPRDQPRQQNDEQHRVGDERQPGHGVQAPTFPGITVDRSDGVGNVGAPEVRARATRGVDEAPPRPVLRWHGGKWKLAPWILAHMPPHEIYVEPYGGAASILLRKPRSYGEIYNDLDGGVVNLFRVLRDKENAARLVTALSLTPFAREEFVGAYDLSDDDVENARRLVVRSFMGFGSDGHNREVKTGFRANSNRSGTTPTHDWTNYPPSLQLVAQRFGAVAIENRPALDVCRQHDGPDTLHYLDPPYLPTTRSQKSRKNGERYHCYAHEMTTEQHQEMLAEIVSLQGMVMLSGYPSALYDAHLPGWTQFRVEALADGARPRIECLWLNAAAIKHRRNAQTDMFVGAA